MTAALLVTATLLAGNGDSTPLTCDGHPADFHVQRAVALVDRAHDTDRFLDATPAKRSEKRGWREHKLCLLDRHRRKRIGHRVDRAKEKFNAHFEALLNPPGRGWLESTAACESHGDPTAVSSTGAYRGKYQFSFSTWASVGGSGDPATAPEREQDYRAALLYQRSGSAPWPVCG